MLKRTLLLLTLSLALFAGQRANAQVYEGGEFLIDAYYGWPNGYTSLFRGIVSEDPEVDNVRIRSLGPLGLKLEYVLSERIGIGLHVNYANSSISATTSELDSAGNYVEYDYKLSVPRFRIMPTFNVHFGDADDFDPYFSLGVGYKSANLIFKSDDPSLENEEESYNVNMTPLAFRLEFGARYFFTDNFGVHSAIGISGGALAVFGVSAKF